MFKRIDKLLLGSFLGPFIVSFAIALFVLIMQFLWLYIDDIAGKGVSIFVLLELIGYLSISTFPMAFPIAVLIASVMVMGNLAERYELSSMKSAGVSLLRVMRSLIACAAAIAFFSYVCSDFIIPISNLKFKTRLYDIRKQKPALTLEKGVFNEDFRQFVIRIGDKSKDGETIRDVMIEDQTTAARTRFSQTLADSGQMYTSANDRFFVMKMFDGVQYQEPGAQGDRQQQKYPFVRTKFSSMRKVWDLKEFEMNATDPDNFKTQRSMLSMRQLRLNIDSLGQTMHDGRQGMAEDLLTSLKRAPVRPPAPAKGDSVLRARMRQDSVKLAQSGARIKSAPVTPPPPAPRPRSLTPEQQLDKPLEQYASFLETFPAGAHAGLLKEATNRVKVAKTMVETRKSQVENRRKELVKTGYELYIKYSFALVCVIFLFIGAPMGAIIRKGGFGYPILVSICFFVTFIFLTITCRKLAELYILTPFWAAMFPCILLSPIGIFLTRRAMNDSQMFNTDRLERWISWLRNRIPFLRPAVA